MSVELIPNNTNYTPQAIFNPHRQALLNHIPPIQDETENLARRRIKRLAGDLEQMIFGNVA